MTPDQNKGKQWQDFCSEKKKCYSIDSKPRSLEVFSVMYSSKEHAHGPWPTWGHPSCFCTFSAVTSPPVELEVFALKVLREAWLKSSPPWAKAGLPETAWTAAPEQRWLWRRRLSVCCRQHPSHPVGSIMGLPRAQGMTKQASEVGTVFVRISALL